MRDFGNKDNLIWVESIFSFKDSEYNNDKEYENIDLQDSHDDICHYWE